MLLLPFHHDLNEIKMGVVWLLVQLFYLKNGNMNINTYNLQLSCSVLIILATIVYVYIFELSV